MDNKKNNIGPHDSEHSNTSNSLEKRLERIEKRLEASASQDQNSWVKFKFFSPIISSVLVALIAIWATHSITGAIERQRLELSHLTAMRELMIELGRPGVDKAEAEATGVLLGAFGSRAVAPLIHELGKPGEARPLAAREGLRAAAFKEPVQTCELLIRVMENRRGLFSWQTHEEVVRLLGEIGCHEAVEILREYKKLLDTREGREKYLSMVREEPRPSVKAMHSLHKQIQKTLQKLGQ